MPVEYDKFSSPQDSYTYEIKSTDPNKNLIDVSNVILAPSSGQGSCQKGRRTIVITLKPNGRSSNMLVTLKVKRASYVEFFYVYGDIATNPYQVSNNK